MKIIFYLVVKPLSLLPLSWLYKISNLLFYLLYYILNYRKKIVLCNLRSSFPELSNHEIQKIAKAFYCHFSDLIIESVKIFSIKENEAIRRCRLTNPEIFIPFEKKGQKIILVGGHYNNWEMLAVAISSQTKFNVSAIYTPLSNYFFNKKVLDSRSRYGLKMISKKESKAFFKNNNHVNEAIIFGADQCPKKNQKVYWTTFLGQETALTFGTEKNSFEYNLPVFYGKIEKVNRGYYTMTFELITNNPKSLPYGYITQKHTQILEAHILENPEFWLWTHRRWKLKRNNDEEIHDNII